MTQNVYKFEISFFKYHSKKKLVLFGSTPLNLRQTIVQNCLFNAPKNIPQMIYNEISHVFS